MRLETMERRDDLKSSILTTIIFKVDCLGRSWFNVYGALYYMLFFAITAIIKWPVVYNLLL